MVFIENFVGLFMESAPWLVIGFICAGFLKAFMPMDLLHRQLGQEGLGSVVKAALIGVPLPLCSCGVIPAAIELRRQGASKSATTAFMVSTPETGVDSISISYALLGPFMAIIRPIAAFSSSLVAGLLVGRDAGTIVSGAKSKQSNSGCCAKNKKAQQSAKGMQRAVESVRYVAFKMVEDTALWLCIGIFFAALVETFVPHDLMQIWGQGLLGMLLVLCISIPMYICATASTPIAAGFLMAGVSPGAALLFMLAGPATNIATLSVVAHELGKRALVAYLTGVVGVALAFGMLTDCLVHYWQIDIKAQAAMSHEMLPHYITIASSILLSALMLRAFCVKLMVSLIPKRT